MLRSVVSMRLSFRQLKLSPERQRLCWKEVVLGIRPEDIHDSQMFLETSPSKPMNSVVKFTSFLVLKYSCTSMLTELRLQHELILVQQLRPVIRSNSHSIWKNLISLIKKQNLQSATNFQESLINPGSFPRVFML